MDARQSWRVATKRKLSESHKGKTGYWKGKKLSEATKKKMSIAKKGKKTGPITDKRREAIKKGMAKK